MKSVVIRNKKQPKLFFLCNIIDIEPQPNLVKLCIK